VPFAFRLRGTVSGEIVARGKVELRPTACGLMHHQHAEPNALRKRPTGRRLPNASRAHRGLTLTLISTHLQRTGVARICGSETSRLIKVVKGRLISCHHKLRICSIQKPALTTFGYTITFGLAPVVVPGLIYDLS